MQDLGKSYWPRFEPAAPIWWSGKGLLNVIHLALNASGSRRSIEPPLREDESTQLREWLRQGSGHEGDMLLLAGGTGTSM